jgi:trimeric autotransporter adhesin
MPDQTKVSNAWVEKKSRKRARQNETRRSIPMKRRLRPQLNYSNVIATMALFVALGGAAVAAGLPKNSVGPKQLKRGAVTSAKIRKKAVTSGKLAPGSVVNGKLGANAVGPGNIGNGAVTSAKIGAGAVIASSIKNGVVTTNKLANEAVSTAKLGKESVTLAKLGPDVAPLLGTLRSGQTLRGVFDVGGDGTEGAEALARGAVSFQFPLLNPPAVTVLKKGETSANCAGLGGGGQTPQATAGNLCIYTTESKNADATTPLAAENSTRLGFGLVAKAEDKKQPFAVYGQWAVTAP